MKKVLQINKTNNNKIICSNKKKKNKQFACCFLRSNVEKNPYHYIHLENMETNFYTIYQRLLNFNP